MSASYSNIQPQQQTRKGLAIASLVLGIISIPTLGLLVVGAIAGIALEAAALSRIKKEPMIYAGKGMAIAGIVTSAVSLILIGVNAAIMVPAVMHRIKLGRETWTINSLRTIHDTQMEFNTMNSRFATLKELTKAGLIDQPIVTDSFVVSGYTYSSSDVSARTYCVHADRVSDTSGTRDFVVCEDGVIRFVESKIPGTVRRGEGIPLNEVR